MDALKSYTVKQLKNIVATHNASEKANVIKAYGKMKKPELVKAISEQIKQEHLMKILDALQLTSVAVGETMKIKVKREPKVPVEPNKMETKMVNQMLMMMEDAGSKAAEKIRKSGKVDEMTAEQQDIIVEDFMKMMEMSGEKAMGSMKKTKNPPEVQLRNVKAILGRVPVVGVKLYGIIDAWWVKEPVSKRITDYPEDVENRIYLSDGEKIGGFNEKKNEFELFRTKKELKKLVSEMTKSNVKDEEPINKKSKYNNSDLINGIPRITSLANKGEQRSPYFIKMTDIEEFINLGGLIGMGKKVEEMKKDGYKLEDVSEMLTNYQMYPKIMKLINDKGLLVIVRKKSELPVYDGIVTTYADGTVIKSASDYELVKPTITFNTK